jgi:hypothetical protein
MRARFPLSDDEWNKALGIWFTSVEVCPDVEQGLNIVPVRGESCAGRSPARLFRMRR